MTKDKKFKECRFSAEVLKEAIDTIKELASKELSLMILSVDHDDANWTYDTVEKFLADFRKYKGYAECKIIFENFNLAIYFDNRNVNVSVKAPNRVDIEKVFHIFEKNLESSKLEPIPEKPQNKPMIFIGHGRSSCWRDLKDHLHDKHDINVEAYETGARAGHSIRDILEEMVSKSSFALFVLTGEDQQADGEMRARQNVIHEVGLFQGHLGFSRAILLLEEGVENFSNVQGIQYISFSKNNIKEVFGEVLATIKREFYK